jgi:predicted transposase/invertase (TIGR01784 family)
MLGKYLDPKNDVAFKKIFGSDKHKDILIHFLNDILGFEGKDEIAEVTFLSPIQDPEIASKKQSIVDVLCKDKDGRQIIVEMQVSEFEGFEKRAQYYAAKAYCRQLNKGKKEDGRYSNLKEIIFIAIADQILFPGKAEYKSDHIILDKENGDHDLKDFSFTFIELPKFKKTSVDELDNVLEQWVYYFKYADESDNKELEKLFSKSDMVIRQAYDALEQHNWTEDELMAYEQEAKRILDNKVVEETMKAKAIAQGKAERNIEIAQKSLDAGLQIDLIAKLTGLSEEEIKKLQKK